MSNFGNLKVTNDVTLKVREKVFTPRSLWFSRRGAKERQFVFIFCRHEVKKLLLEFSRSSNISDINDNSNNSTILIKFGIMRHHENPSTDFDIS
jgi:hypothetical protein